MKAGEIKKTGLILSLLIFFVVAAVITIEAHPFNIGERLSYKVIFLGFVIGKETLEVKDIVEVNGYPTYHFISTVKTVGLASLFYHFNERIESFADINTLYPHRSVIHSQEGAVENKKVWIEVNLKERIAVIENKKINYTWRKKFSLPILEAVSLTYWLRAQDLKVGKKFSASFIEANNIRKLEVKVLTREEVHTSAGSFSTFMCSELGSTERKMWFSDDKRHLPVKLQVETSFGVITACLSEIE